MSKDEEIALLRDALEEARSGIRFAYDRLEELHSEAADLEDLPDAKRVYRATYGAQEFLSDALERTRVAAVYAGIEDDSVD